jgi:hypothetical protein
MNSEASVPIQGICRASKPSLSRFTLAPRTGGFRETTHLRLLLASTEMFGLRGCKLTARCLPQPAPPLAGEKENKAPSPPPSRGEGKGRKMGGGQRWSLLFDLG